NMLLMRLDRPIGTWLLLLPGWWSIVLAKGGLDRLEGREWYLMLLFGIGAVVMRGAGCVINDLWDRRLDRRVNRTRLRPLASGAVSTFQALVYAGGLLLVGFLILIQMTQTAVLLGCLSLCFVIIYPSMKRITWWPQAFLGLTFNFGALIGWAAVTDTLSGSALLLYIAGFFWTLGYDTIYAHQDIEDDMQVGIKSSALRLGGDSKKWITRFYAVAWLLVLAALLLAKTGGVAMLVLALAGAHLTWQLRRWNPSSPQSSLRIFKSNRDFGLIVLVAIACASVLT
ncbi:MAG: 4-hydroxybenzoate polyprenyltransferase, partial [Micavibrio sp.]|nr:4-hydroxybenzoate polyprenyltransferase [Micavibrio sp.]